MLIEKLENKIKLAFSVSIGSFILCFMLVIIVCIFAYNLILEERKNVYVIDSAGIPALVQRTNIEDNEEVEAKSHVNMFHMFFFNLAPDDKFIESNIKKAMYLIDESGAREYANLREQQFYNQLLSNSMLASIQNDSLNFDFQTKKFTYYGTQRFERKTTILKRKLVTEGFLRRVPRSENNPHGFIITNWNTVINEDIDIKHKRTY